MIVVASVDSVKVEIVERTRSFTVPATVERWKVAAVAAVKVIRSAQVEPLVECWTLKVAEPSPRGWCRLLPWSCRPLL